MQLEQMEGYEGHAAAPSAQWRNRLIDTNVVQEKKASSLRTKSSRTTSSRTRSIQNTLADKEATDAPFEQAVEKLEKHQNLTSFDVCFSVDERTKDLVVELRDHATREVLRQIPPEEILNMRSRLRDLHGVFFDHQA